MLEDFQRKLYTEISLCFYCEYNKELNVEALKYFAKNSILKLEIKEDRSLYILFKGNNLEQSDYSINLKLGDCLAYNGYNYYPVSKEKLYL